MSTIKALVAAFGLRGATKNRVLRKAAKRWSGFWTLLLVLDIIRFVRRRDRQVIARRVLKDGEVLVISSTVSRKQP